MLFAKGRWKATRFTLPNTVVYRGLGGLEYSTEGTSRGLAILVIYRVQSSTCWTESATPHSSGLTRAFIQRDLQPRTRDELHGTAVRTTQRFVYPKQGGEDSSQVRPYNRNCDGTAELIAWCNCCGTVLTFLGPASVVEPVAPASKIRSIPRPNRSSPQLPTMTILRRMKQASQNLEVGF